MYKILIVDDEEKIRALISRYAIFEGHEVVEAGDGMEAIEVCKRESPDIVILDIMMPELDGFSACREIRKFSDVPVIMLSARGEEYDKINAFEVGIDDYVVKPFSPKELMLRVEAVMKRYKKGIGEGGGSLKQGESELEIDGIKVDLSARIVYVNGKSVELTPKEYDLLVYMMKNRNIALSREKLISEVWGYDYFGDDRTLDTHIKLLRKNLEDNADHIVTLRGVGYRFDSDAKQKE